MIQPIHREIVRLQSRVFENRLKLSKVLERAGVQRSSWARYVSDGSEPKISTVEKIDAAIEEMVGKTHGTPGAEEPAGEI